MTLESAVLRVAYAVVDLTVKALDAHIVISARFIGVMIGIALAATAGLTIAGAAYFSAAVATGVILMAGLGLVAGAALLFLLVGPSTNISNILVLQK